MTLLYPLSVGISLRVLILDFFNLLLGLPEARGLIGGINISSIEMEIPAIVAKRYPALQPSDSSDGLLSPPYAVAVVEQGLLSSLFFITLLIS